MVAKVMKTADGRRLGNGEKIVTEKITYSIVEWTVGDSSPAQPCEIYSKHARLILFVLSRDASEVDGKAVFQADRVSSKIHRLERKCIYIK
jgi:hypothetical protein